MILPQNLKEVNHDLVNLSVEFAGERDPAHLERIGRELAGLRRMAAWLRSKEQWVAA